VGARTVAVGGEDGGSGGDEEEVDGGGAGSGLRALRAPGTMPWWKGKCEHDSRGGGGIGDERADLCTHQQPPERRRCQTRLCRRLHHLLLHARLQSHGTWHPVEPDLCGDSVMSGRNCRRPAFALILILPSADGGGGGRMDGGRDRDVE